MDPVLLVHVKCNEICKLKTVKDHVFTLLRELVFIVKEQSWRQVGYVLILNGKKHYY